MAIKKKKLRKKLWHVVFPQGVRVDRKDGSQLYCSYIPFVTEKKATEAFDKFNGAYVEHLILNPDGKYYVILQTVRNDEYHLTSDELWTSYCTNPEIILKEEEYKEWLKRSS